MIKSITVGRYLNVSGGTSTHVSKSYSANNGNGKMGDMLFDFDTQQFKVFDGSTWQTMYSAIPMIQLDGEAESLLNWARTKRQEEIQLDTLAKNNPVVKDLVDQIKEKEEQLRMVQILLKPEATPMGY
jgi:hypothetical protein